MVTPGIELEKIKALKLSAHDEAKILYRNFCRIAPIAQHQIYMYV